MEVDILAWNIAERTTCVDVDKLSQSRDIIQLAFRKGLLEFWVHQELQRSVGYFGISTLDARLAYNHNIRPSLFVFRDGLVASWPLLNGFEKLCDKVFMRGPFCIGKRDASDGGLLFLFGGVHLLEFLDSCFENGI